MDGRNQLLCCSVDGEGMDTINFFLICYINLNF